MPEQIKVRGAVKIDGLPDKDCFEDGKTFLEWLTSHLVLEIPTDITNVVIDSNQPKDRNTLWIRRSKAGAVIGFYLFSDGAWTQLFPTPEAVFWIWGDSREVPPGYQLIDSSHNLFTAAEAKFFTDQYRRSDDDTHYTYFATTFIGL